MEIVLAHPHYTKDLWGYMFWDMDAEGSKAHYVAVVGAANGWDFVDVSGLHRPAKKKNRILIFQQLAPSNPVRIGFIPGCINNWRSTQRYFIRLTIYF